jgi:hypothetical protein
MLAESARLELAHVIRENDPAVRLGDLRGFGLNAAAPEL